MLPKMFKLGFFTKNVLLRMYADGTAFKKQSQCIWTEMQD